MKPTKKFKILCMLLVATLAFTTIQYSVLANQITWEYNSDSKTLFINGNGEMQDYENEVSMPWYDYLFEIETVVFDDNITYIGSYSLCAAKNLKQVTLPKSLTGIGEFVFASCPELKELTLSSEVDKIGDTSFAFDGTVKKSDFVLHTEIGSYALQTAIESDVNYDCDYVKSQTTYPVNFSVENMTAYFPYYAHSDGTFAFYSSGTRNTYGYVYDENLNELAYNEDNGSSMNFRMELELEKGNLYYLAVKVHSYRFTSGITVGIEPISFTATGSVKAMLNPQGEPSDITLSTATVDGIEVGELYSITVTKDDMVKTFEYNGMTQNITLSPDEETTVVFMACDMNNDGYVNAKDYAIMRKSNSPCLGIYKNFINYKCQ